MKGGSGPASRGWLGALWRHPFLRHLRLPFNLLLSPVYLWGVLLAGGHAGEGRIWLGYLAVHLFLYGGTTAFNSYYDRDEGPVGGMLEPPAVSRGLLPFSLAVQALGLPLALVVGGRFALAWLLLFVIFAAYSHPAVRLKASAVGALTAIALGQGAVGFALGWLAADPARPLWSSHGLAGMLSTALVIVGLYLVTQSYQTLEDRRRGDLTLSVVLGPRRALRLATAVLAAGGAVMLPELWRRGGVVTAAVAAAFFVLLGAWMLGWSSGFDEGQVTRNFRTAMRLAAVSAAGFTAFVVALLW